MTHITKKIITQVAKAWDLNEPLKGYHPQYAAGALLQTLAGFTSADDYKWISCADGSLDRSKCGEGMAAISDILTAREIKTNKVSARRLAQAAKIVIAGGNIDTLMACAEGVWRSVSGVTHERSGIQEAYVNGTVNGTTLVEIEKKERERFGKAADKRANPEAITAASAWKAARAAMITQMSKFYLPASSELLAKELDKCLADHLPMLVPKPPKKVTVIAPTPEAPAQADDMAAKFAALQEQMAAMMNLMAPK